MRRMEKTSEEMEEIVEGIEQAMEGMEKTSVMKVTSPLFFSITYIWLI
jgi:hypothetical protein